jgi:CDP-6-deoxy-D-xylo-4-hexulose-3-dehydrase
MKAYEIQRQIEDLLEQYYELKHKRAEFVPGDTPCPVSGRYYDANDMKKLNAANLDFWLTTGRFNAEFERGLTKTMGVKSALTVNSGSSANLVAMSSLTTDFMGDRRIKPGDEVISCATGFPTTVNPAIQANLTPVFVDVHIPTYNIDPSKIEAAITEKTKAIMVAHTLGNPFDLHTVMDIAKKYNLFVIEDCCDAMGATFDGKSVGSFGDIGTLSFYPAHHITTGEGGAVFTKNNKIKRAMECVRDWGRDCWCEPGVDNTCKKRFGWKLGNLPHGYDHKYIYSQCGYNLKMTDMQASIGCSQLDKLPYFVERRRANYDQLRKGLRHFEDRLIFSEHLPQSNPSWFGFPITMRNDSDTDRDELVKHLNDHLIGTRLLFAGNITCQPYMQAIHHRVVGSLHNSNKVMRDTFWIGVHPGLTREHIDYMLEVIRDWIKK